MRFVSCTLLAFAATLLAAVNGADMKQVSFYETLAEGGSTNITEHGPFTINAACDSLAVTMNVYVEATEEDYIFSDQGSPENLAAGDTSSYTAVFRESHYGNNYGDGGFVSASGYQLSWNGESVIGLYMTSGSTQPLFGDNVTCVISGILQLIEKWQVTLGDEGCAIRPTRWSYPG